MSAPALDPVTRDPFNAETPTEALLAPVTPVPSFFVRNHFPVPAVDRAAWRLRIGGAVREARALSYEDVLALPARTLEVAMECAGNGRTRMTPRPEGTPWGERAVSCGRFRGASLRDAMDASGVLPEAVELLFVGADAGLAHGQHMAYERSLPLATALHPDTLLCYELNGEPLTPEHGAPVRLLVPGWYGVASVKWLTEVRAVTKPFQGFFQAEHYMWRPQPEVPPTGPVREMLVKSLVLTPSDGDLLQVGEPVRVRGKAWSGAAPVRGVEVTTDGGRTWTQARLTPGDGPYSWCGFEHEWRPTEPGEHVVGARARDAGGRVQPEAPAWNVLGYGNNAITWRRVRVA